MVANARQILDTTTTNQHNGVLLEVVALAADVRRDFETVGQPYPRDLPHRRVRLFRRGRVDARAHAAFLRAGLQRRHGAFGAFRRSRLTN